MQAEAPRYGHVEDRLSANPTLLPFLERLTALALPIVPSLDTMSLSNIFWALGTLRLSPGGEKLLCRS